MNILNSYKKFLITCLAIVTSVSIILGQFNYKPNQIGHSNHLTGENYITGEDGIPRMSINIWGHVKYPGNYLVYDSIDILTCLSLAGGPLKGANLSSLEIISKDGSSYKINLENISSNPDSINIILKPNDTIHVDESLSSYLLSRSNVINTLLQITNLILISNR